MVDGACLFAVFVCFDLWAAAVPAEDGVDETLGGGRSTSFDLVYSVFSSAIVY